MRAAVAAGRVGPPGLRGIVAGTSVRARRARRVTPAAPTCFWKPSPHRASGDVLVIDNGGRIDEGCIGDLVVGEAFMSGLAATVCWGTHRDTGAIRAMGARVWSLGTCSERSARTAHALGNGA